MRLAYADPVYLGMARRYPEHPQSHVWDDPASHAQLMAELDATYDGWALSASSTSLQVLLPLAPPPRPGGRLGQAVRGVQAQRPLRLHVGAGHLPPGPRLVQGRCPGDP